VNAPTPSDSALELRNLTKSFGALKACDVISLRVTAGTIHGIVGENGAGKSTAMKLVYGMLRPDSGEIFVGGRLCNFKSPAAAIHSGIGMVHQHFMLAGPHTGLDNILLGAEPGNAFKIARNEARRELKNLSTKHGLAVNLDDAVQSMPVGVQQRLEILKLLYRKARILILDEPTAVLTPREIADLFGALRSLKAEGNTILLVTHKLKEIMTVTDEVTVFRAGKIVGTQRTVDTSAAQLAEQMIGRKPLANPEVRPPGFSGAQVLKVSRLTVSQSNGESLLSDVSFHVGEAEIVGIAGIEGNGQSDLIRALMGISAPDLKLSGEILIRGRNVSNWKSSAIRRLGVALIPEDRQREGLLLNRPLTENYMLGLQREPEFSRNGFLNLTRVLTATRAAIEKFNIRAAGPLTPAADLSGGNQQKLIVSRELSRQPKFIIAAQPSRGVDLGATQMIHGQIIAAAQRGAGVLLISSDLDEVLSLSHRILVMSNGRLVAEYNRGAATEQELGLKMGGA
jgi:simple sugar transport system ATP-binding protein